MPRNFSAQTRPITMAILAMGGEGGGVLADWCVDMAEHSGYWAQTTSVPGVAQRTGTTIYYLEFFPKFGEANTEPILSTMAAPGEVDIVIASELMEAGRAVQRGFVTPTLTTFIASTHRVYSMAEKMALGDGRVDSDVLLDSARNAAKVFIPSDFAKVAEETNSVISSALYGALAGSGALPFEKDDFIAAIERGGVGVANSIKAFDRSYEIALELLKPIKISKAVDIAIGIRPKDSLNSASNELTAEEELAIVINPVGAVGSKLAVLAARIQSEFPPSATVMLVNGIKRCADYQDVKYAQKYLDRLVSVKESDSKHPAGNGKVLQEAARYTALWMTYEDTIRVADLKVRRSRFTRVGDEAKIKSDQVLQVREFLHPQAEEFADTLPTPIGKWILRTKWVTKFIEKLSQNGIILQTTSVHGYLLLYFIARCKPIRPRSLRYQLEQERIDKWISTVNEVLNIDYQLALEVIESANVIKGYGSTHRNGWANFEVLMEQVALHKHEAAIHTRIAELRKAALADENGDILRAALTN
jgi:indolepyruvate ferredoxin oxidoreductase beta subunit